MPAWRPLAIALVCVLAVAATADGQTTGSIRGVVTDDTGAVLPGATVTIGSDVLIGSTRTLVTNEVGVFRFPSLSVGTYSVEVSMPGFETIRFEDIEVGLNATANVPVTLKLATVTETVTVTGDSPVVDVTKSSVSTSFKNEMVQDLPTYRNMYDYVQMAPGMSAVYEGGSGDRTVAFGSNQQSNSWNIDGIETSAPETGSSWWTINPDAIEEVQVMGVGAPAEFGNAMGAVFNVVTKKGGNQYSGTANLFFQHDKLTGENVVVDGFGFKRDRYKDFTGLLGGPLVRDRSWFFGSFEYRRDSSTQPGNDPAEAGADLDRSEKYDIKVTTRLNDRNELVTLFHYNNWGYIDGGTPYVAPSAAYVERGHDYAWAGHLTSTISESTLLEVKYAGWWSDDISDSPTESMEEPFIDWTPPEGGPPTYSGGVYYPWDYVTWSHQIRGKVTHYTERFLNSQHEFKFGVQFARGDAKTNVGIGPNGTYTYNYYGYLYRAYQDPYQYGGISKDLGFFLDDTVNVGSKLTLNLGVRFDHNTGGIPDYKRLISGTPSIATAINAIETDETISGNPDLIRWNIVSPRLGFTCDVTGEGRSVLKGFFGVFYDQNVIGNWDAPPPGLPPFQVYSWDPDLGRGDLSYELTSSDIGFHPNLRPPRTMQYLATYEQQISEKVSLSVGYVHKNTKDLVGWEILGGEYEPFPFVDPFTGKEYQLLNIIEQPTIRKGNDPGDFPGSENMDYKQSFHAVVFTFNKRFADRWSLMSSYTWSKSEGLIPRPWREDQFNPFYGNKVGSDPNNWWNAYGRLQGDRPHSFRLQGVFELPHEVLVSASLNFETGRPFNRQINVFDLNQGVTRVIMEPIGARPELRRKSIENVDLMFGKRFPMGSRASLNIDGVIYNLLNRNSEIGFADLRLQSPDEDFVADDWVLPRRLMLKLSFQF